MQERTKIYILTFLLLAGVFASTEYAPRVFAETVYLQSENSTSYDANASTARFHLVGTFTPPSDVVLDTDSSASWSVLNTSCSQMSPFPNTGTITIASSTSPYPATTAGFGIGVFSQGGFAFPNALPIGSGQTVIGDWGGGTVTLYGGTEYAVYFESNCSAGQILKIYGKTGFDFYGYINTSGALGGLQERTDTHIIDFSPKNVIVNEGGDPDEPIEWELEYWFNSDDVGTYDKVIVEFANIEPTHPQLYIPDLDTIDASGGALFTGEKIVNSGHMYVIACFYNSTTGFKDKCRNYEFVNSESAVATHITQAEFEYGDDEAQDCSTFGDLSERIGCRTANFFRSSMGFLFIPSSGSISALKDSTSALTNKLPFSAVTEFSDAWDAGFGQSTTTAVSTLSLNFYGEEANLISTSTLTAVGGTTSAVNGLRNLIGMGLWILFGWYVFNRVSKTFLTEY